MTHENPHTRGTTKNTDSHPEHTIGLSPFWKEGYVANAQTFATQIESLSRTPRPRLIFSSRMGLMTSHEVRARKISFTEEEGMRDLDSHVKKTRSYVRGLSDPEAKDIQNFLTGFEDHFTFLGTPEYETACQGIARRWIEYVTTVPNGVINVFDSHMLDRRRSYNQILDDVLSVIDDEASTDVKARIVRDPQQWQESNNAKLVIVDDWMIGGSTVDSLTRDLYTVCEDVGKTSLKDQVEVHLLIANQDQLGRKNLTSDLWPFPGTVRSYYKAPSRYSSPLNRNGTNFSGAECSVDYGFDVAFHQIGFFMEAHGQMPTTPDLTYIEHAYRPDPLLRDDAYVAKMKEYMSLRDHIESLQANISGDPVVQLQLASAEALRQKFEEELGKPAY